MGQIASVQSPDMDPEVAQQLQILNESYNQARSRLDRVQDDLALLLKQGGGQLIDKLEIAMTRAYKLAILIRGPYDVESREVNKKQQQADLGSLAIATFQEVESSANALLAAVAQQSSTVMSVRNEIVMPGKERIEKLQLRINDQMMGLNEKIAQIDSIIQNLQNEVSQRNDALRNLHEKIAESQQARLASDIGFSILTFGIGNLIGGGPMGPDFGLQEEFRRQETELNDRHNELNRAAAEQAQIMQRRFALEAQLQAVVAAKALVPGVLSQVELQLSKCEMLQRQLTPLKEAASQLTAKMTQTSQGRSKEEIAVGLLQVCSDALMDSALTDEAAMIKDEILKGYEGAVPDAVKQVAGEVESKSQRIASTPSIRQL